MNIAAPRAGEPTIAGYLVSYPKSGRTWLRFMMATYLGELIDGRSIGLAEFFRYIPNSGANADKGVDAMWPEGRTIEHPIVAAHSAKFIADGLPTVVLLRHPVEVLVSHFHHESKHRPQDRFAGSLEDFLASDRGWSRLSDYLQAVRSHMGAHVQLVTYDQLHANTAEVLEGVLRHFSIEVDEATVGRAVESGQFSAMATMEEAEGLGSSSYDYGDPDARRVRRGLADGGRAALSAPERKAILAALRHKMTDDTGGLDPLWQSEWDR